MHQPEGCCCQELAEEVRKLRADVKAIQLGWTLLDSIVEGSQRRPGRRPRRARPPGLSLAGRAAS
jgi:hypothetical protein